MDTDKPTTPPTPSAEHDRLGRFTAGNKARRIARKGKKSRVDLIGDALWKSLSPSRLKALAERLVEDAIGGGATSASSRAELLNRLAGRPGSATLQKELSDLRRDIDTLKSKPAPTGPSGAE